MDGAPLAEGEVGSMTDGTAFLGLFRYFQKYGPVYKLCFGPKSFIVVSDPTIIKFILKTNTPAYDKVGAWARAAGRDGEGGQLLSIHSTPFISTHPARAFTV